MKCLCVIFPKHPLVFTPHCQTSRIKKVNVGSHKIIKFIDYVSL